MRKIHRQDAALIRYPPTRGPAAVATPPNPDQAPMASLRSSAANDASRMARLPGVSRAAPTPWRTRSTMRALDPGAREQAAEARANHATPTMNTRRRPKRSPSDPPSRSNDERVRVYPVTTHCRVPRVAWKSRPIVGRAMPMTVASMAAMPDPRTVAAMTHRPADERYSRPPTTSLPSVGPGPVVITIRSHTLGPGVRFARFSPGPNVPMKGDGFGFRARSHLAGMGGPRGWRQPSGHQYPTLVGGPAQEPPLPQDPVVVRP